MSTEKPNTLYINLWGGPGCHVKGTPILMFDGRLKAVEDVSVGDELMGPDSTPRVVLDLVRGRDQMYEVIPTKGEPFIVNADHILSLAKSKSAKQGPEVLNTSVRHCLSKTMRYWAARTYKLYRTGVEFGGKSQVVPPYIMGLWLGDGHTHAARITNMDAEVIDCWCGYAESLGLSVTPYSNASRAMTYSVHPERSSYVNPNTMRLLLDELGVLGNKHIPYNYLCGSREQRLELLAGLIDTDGCLGAGGCMSICTKLKTLADSYCFLAKSLGLAAYAKPRSIACGKGKQDKRTYWYVYLSGDLSVIPTKIPRKQASPRKQVKNVLHTGFKIEEIGEGDYYGFTVDKDHLYLMGDFTVTHNCSKSTNAADVFAKLKRHGYNAELIQEYAKKKVWGGERKVLGHQLYVTSKQVHAQFNILNEVDVAVTDSPIMLGPFLYGGFGDTPSFTPYMKEVFNLFNNLNIYLIRNPDVHPYNEKGRVQTEKESIMLDLKLRTLMSEHNIPFTDVQVGPNTADEIVKIAIEQLKS